MEQEVSGKNPLEIPEILENVLECLPVEDLKASRLVSKFWRDCGVGPMKKKENVAVRLGYLDDKTINDLGGFLDCLNSVAAGGNGTFPCSKVFVDAALIRKDKEHQNQDEVLFANFLEKISPWVMELGLRTNRGRIITTDAFPLSLNFPKLKLLKLAPYGMTLQTSKGSSGSFYEFVTNIIEKAPSLRNVDINVNNQSVGVDAIMKASKSSFTEIRIVGPISNSSLELLSNVKRDILLKSLDLSCDNSEVNNTSLFQLLRSQKDSLEKLILYFDISSPIMVSFPEMSTLKSLTIKVYGNDENDEEDEDDLVNFPVISYQRQFPALKTLHLHQWDCQVLSLCNDFIKPEMPPVETIEELTLLSDNDDESLIIAQNAVRIFPNVKKLEVAANPVMLPTIFENWTNLEQITLRYNRVPTCLHGSVNRVLMGHTRSEYKKLQKRIKKEGQNFDWNRLEPGNAKKSIVNLQKLRVLRFEEAVEILELEVDRAPFHLIVSRIQSLRCVDFGDRRYPMEAKIDKSWLAELNEDCVVLWNHVTN